MSCQSLCGCMIPVGIITGSKNPIFNLLDQVGARQDVDIAFVLKWETVTDIDSWVIEPNGTAIGFNTPYNGKVDGTQTFNYILDRRDVTVSMDNQYLTSNKGNLDKDCISCSPVGIENLVYFDRSLMQDGLYKYRIDDFDGDHHKGFTVYLIVRDRRLNLEGIAEFKWEGAFNHEKLRRESQDMIHMCKNGNSLTFKIMHPNLKLVMNDGINLVNTELFCSLNRPVTQPTPSRPNEEWRPEYTDTPREDDNYTWTLRHHQERKFVNGQSTNELRNHRDEEINKQPKERWVREKTGSRETETSLRTTYYATYCDVKYLGETKTNETRNCSEVIERSIDKNRQECTPFTPQYCHHTSHNDRVTGRS